MPVLSGLHTNSKCTHCYKRRTRNYTIKSSPKEAKHDFIYLKQAQLLGQTGGKQNARARMKLDSFEACILRLLKVRIDARLGVDDVGQKRRRRTRRRLGRQEVARVLEQAVLVVLIVLVLVIVLVAANHNRSFPLCLGLLLLLLLKLKIGPHRRRKVLRVQAGCFP